MDRFVYADNAATTAVSEEVRDVMLPYFTQIWGNPSSLHSKGREASRALISAREKIAEILDCSPKEIYFTSCGSEADNWAIKGVAKANAAKGKHIITTKIEHHAVLHTMQKLEKEGFKITYLDVDKNGLLNPQSVADAIRDDTILIAVMYANNEIGTIMPIKQISEIAKKHKIIFFTDAVQAVGNMPISIKELGVDMLSLSGHKLHAPKGIGLLYIKTGTKIANLIDGGAQERGKRAGTENIPYIIGLSKALEIANSRLPEIERVKAMRNRLIDGILEKIPYSILNGSKDERLPGNVNISFRFIEGEGMLFLLDKVGICASTGSACSSTSLEPSHVLLAIGLPHEVAHGSLRISLSYDNTDEDVDYILEKLPPIIQRLRDMSPLYEKQLKAEKGMVK